MTRDEIKHAFWTLDNRPAIRSYLATQLGSKSRETALDYVAWLRSTHSYILHKRAGEIITQAVAAVATLTKEAAEEMTVSA